MPLPTDPLLANQWHLINSTPGLLDLNVAGVWNPTQGAAYTGAGITIVAIDDGFDYTHSDLAPNYRTDLDYDFEFDSLDPFGSASESHGTAVMGIIGAAANGSGVVGIAYEAQLIGYRTEGLITDAWLGSIAESIGYAATNALADVVNISQGIANDAESEFGVGYTASRFDDIETAIGTAVNSGRGGLGTIIVKSAGNSREDNYDVNADDWANDTRQIVVAAVDQNGFVSDYSSFGAAILVSGFGTPGEVVTTDRVGAAGYVAGDFTSTFNGTSSAAPMVAGVVGLMLDANSELGWRDVQSILAVTARHVGSAVGAPSSGSELFNWQFNAASTWNGGGMHFSNDYGYGLVDALAAVRLAETWLLGNNAAQTSANEFSNNIDMLNTLTAIPDGTPAGLTFSGAAAFDDLVDRVTLTVTFSTTYMADVRIVITSPDGSTSLVLDNQAGTLDFDGSWTFETQAFRGERAGGTWSVQISDMASGDALAVSDIVLRTYGDVTAADRYVYTNEYSDYAGQFGHVTAVTDTNGGSDTVNASAVTTGSFIRLDGNAGAIDGVLTSFTGMENAIGGDGADTIAGNALGNVLHGMRGADFFYGYSGNDSLHGGDGADNIWGGTGADAHYGGAGTDYARYDDANYGNLVIRLDNAALNTGAAAGDTYNGIEGLVGGAGNDTVVGNAQNNYLFGSGGNDMVYGGTGNDQLYGDAGGDNLWGGAGADVHQGGDGVDYARYDDANHGNLTIRLDVSGANTGAAAGDTYVGIEGLVGGAGADVVIGNSSNNWLFGQGGADYIDGLGGNDYLNGGAGADRFRFSTALSASNVDQIADFQHLVDDILLVQSIFAGIGPALTADEFRIGMAQDANDRILYNNTNGQIFYDSNGNAAGGMIQFATVAAGTVLTFDDFVMV